MQLQIFDQAGQLVYDSGAVTQAELTWALRPADGEAVKSGLYAYTLSVKEAGAEAARVRPGHFIVDRAREHGGKTDRVWITSQNESGVGTELTVARNEGETIAGTGADAGGRERAGQDDQQTTSSNQNGSAAMGVSGTAGRIAKFTSADEIGSSRMTETASGNVGIGTTTPAAKLEVASNWTGEVGALQVSGDKPTIRFTDGPIAGNQSWILHPGSDGLGNLQFFRRAGATTWNPVMSLGTNGNVGIGTNGPTSKLEIAAQDGLGITDYQPFLTLSDATANGTFRCRLQNVNGGFNFQTHDQTLLGGTAMYIQARGFTRPRRKKRSYWKG